MNYVSKNKMEAILSSVIAISLVLLVLSFMYKLRLILPWRVNCWFCNSNMWMKFLDRNCWTCPKCEQYNGFTKDGDYNKPLPIKDHMKGIKSFFRSPPRNGLCKMCNINQQLKVAQLANFVPMNQNNYDSEVETYRLQLEKAYKLCGPCKKVLQRKLHKEKELLLNSKLIENRSPEKRHCINRGLETRAEKTIRYVSKVFASILIFFVSFECYKLLISDKDVYNMTHATFEIVSGIINRITSILKMKLCTTFPFIESYLLDIQILNLSVDKIINIDLSNVIDISNWWVQRVIGSAACLMHIFGLILHLAEKSNNLNYSNMITALLWIIFAVMLWPYSKVITPLTRSFIKLLSSVTVIAVYYYLKEEAHEAVNSSNVKDSSKRMKNLANRTMQSMADDDEDSYETDDDVSLSKFGLHNFTDSSNEHIGTLNNSLVSGRAFTPRSNESLWSKPKLNSTFCMNSVLKSPSLDSSSVFVKPMFRKYQDLTKDDSDSDLDESISSLCIGSPKKIKERKNPVFSLRKFNATPSFVAPTPLNRARPLISPSKLGHSTSWVAGGYWGSEGERQLFNINGSRSSSQSSGFESQTSSVNQRNLFSQPPSREESVCGDVERSAAFHMPDKFQAMPAGGYPAPAPLARPLVPTPVFPTLQYNGHVHIPHSPFPSHLTNTPQNVYPHNYPGHSIFKAPNTSSLIKLPQDKTFMARS